jgi:hypothetical protein
MKYIQTQISSTADWPNKEICPKHNFGLQPLQRFFSEFFGKVSPKKQGS